MSLLCLVPTARLSVQADVANVPSLVVSQIKITSSNGQFVTLYNTTNSALDMGKYQLEYFNSYDLSKSTSSKLVALSGTVPPHGYFMVNDGALLLCYQLTVDSVSLGFSSTAGLVELLSANQASPGSPVIPALQDYVGWSKTAANGAQTLPADVNAFLARRPLNAQNNPAVATAGSGTWQSVQPAASNPCNLVGTDLSNSAPVPNGQGGLLPATEPPATIVSLSAGQATQATGPSLPLADVGLMSPVITELLPNPLGTGNDASDEFVELYNPNALPFDLSGFILQSGITSLHKFTFPAGTTLAAHGFTADYSADTGLSLSNGGGQAQLLDPLGKAVAGTAAYGVANDGQAWALAKGKWYWTTTLTPGRANSIKEPVKTAKSARKSSKPSKNSSTGGKSPYTGAAATAAGSSAASDATAITPIHPWTLALIAGLALLYGAYEYRTDLANRLYRLRSYFKRRR
jgi:hypothetical protein